MANLRYKGHTYQHIVRPWKKGKGRNEVIKYPTGTRFDWERIPYTEYLEIKALANK